MCAKDPIIMACVALLHSTRADGMTMVLDPQHSVDMVHGKRYPLGARKQPGRLDDVFDLPAIQTNVRQHIDVSLRNRMFLARITTVSLVLWWYESPPNMLSRGAVKRRVIYREVDP